MKYVSQLNTIIDKRKNEIVSLNLSRTNKAMRHVTLFILDGLSFPGYMDYQKFRKPDIPIRLIVDGIGSTSHNLARTLARILKPLSGRTDFFTKEGFEFVRKVSSMKLEENEIKVSFDVESMYKNVSGRKCIDIIRKLLGKETDLEKNTKLDVYEIIAGIEVCLGGSQFTFWCRIYDRIERLAMGSRISQVSQNPTMNDFETGAIQLLSQPTRIWWRYAFDTFIIIQEHYAEQLRTYKWYGCIH